LLRPETSNDDSILVFIALLCVRVSDKASARPRRSSWHIDNQTPILAKACPYGTQIDLSRGKCNVPLIMTIVFQMPRIRDHHEPPPAPRRDGDHLRCQPRAARARQRDRHRVNRVRAHDAGRWDVECRSAARVRERRFWAGRRHRRRRDRSRRLRCCRLCDERSRRLRGNGGSPFRRVAG